MFNVQASADGQQQTDPGGPGAAAAAALTEAMERVERARGHLYEFHQLIGGADMALDGVLADLEAAGQHGLADTIRDHLYGRGVVGDAWTFELVEDFDDGFYGAWRAAHQLVCTTLAGGRRHRHEERMKADRRARGIERSNHGRKPTP